MLRRDTIIIGGAATHRGVETSVREAFNVRTVFALPRARARGSAKTDSFLLEMPRVFFVTGLSL